MPRAMHLLAFNSLRVGPLRHCCIGDIDIDFGLSLADCFAKTLRKHGVIHANIGNTVRLIVNRQYPDVLDDDVKLQVS